MSTRRKQRIKAAQTISTRLSLRIAPTVKDLLRSAAKARGCSLTDFILRSSQDAAEAVLAEQTRFILPPKQWAAFNDALDAPAKEIPEVRRLLSAPSIFDAR